MARALVAKAVYDMPTTRVLLDRLDTDVVLRRICGWERRSEVPSESVFSAPRESRTMARATLICRPLWPTTRPIHKLLRLGRRPLGDARRPADRL